MVVRKLKNKGEKMSKYKRYQHIERYENDEVENINLGICYVFPKLDGSNSCVWYEDGEIKTGSRNRELSLENDNQGFCKYILNDRRFIDFFNNNPHIKLYGEWLVPHSLKTYHKDAWNKFYIFDVLDDSDYIPYTEYKILLDNFDLDYIPCIAKIENGVYDQFVHIMKQNKYLIEDGKGIGEGIVIKNYNYKNKYGRVIWAKIVTNKFKEKHIKERGFPEIKGKQTFESSFLEKHLSFHLIEKVYQKIKNKNGWNSKKIPDLLNEIYHDLINEELWNFIKKNKKVVIDFSLLQRLVNIKIKEYKKELF